MLRPYTLPVRPAQFIIILAWMGSIWCSAGHAQAYRCQGQKGAVIYTDKPLPQQPCETIHQSLTEHVSISNSGGTVYRIEHADGRTEYTNAAAHHEAHALASMPVRLFDYEAACAACATASTVNWHAVPLERNRYRQAIRQAAARHRLDTAYVRAIIHAESAFNPRALSRKGAQGLMQLMPATAAAMDVDDAFDADENIQGGSRYLAQLLTRYGGDKMLAAAAFNAGPTAVDRHAGVPPYHETQTYVNRVQTLYARYRAVP